MAQDNKTTDGSHDTTGTEAENSEEILHSSSKGATAAPPVLQSPAVKKMVLCVVMVMLFFFIASLAFAIALLIEIRQDNGQAVQVTEQLAPTSATTPIDLPPYPSPVWPATAPAIALIPEQNQNASTPSSSSSQPAQAPIQAPSMNNPAIPSFVEPVSRPTLPTQQPQQGVQPTTSSPTVSPHFEETRAILIERSPSSQAALSRHSSPQYLALEWLVQEEDASTYSVQRLIQRWVMATVFYSLGGGRSNSSSWTRSDNWLDRTTNECSWYTVVPDNGCDQHGNITGIDLRDNNLFGTIPHEISLLSNHLGKTL